MGKAADGLRRFCVRAALCLALCLFAGLTAAGMLVTAHLGRQSWSHEAVVFSHDALPATLALTALLLADRIVFVIHYRCLPFKCSFLKRLYRAEQC